MLRNNVEVENVLSLDLRGVEMKYVTIALLFTILAASCTPTASTTLPPDTAVTSPPEGTMPSNEPPVNPLAPQPDDENLVRGELFLQEATLVIRESFPPQVSLTLRGDLPTPCHALRAILNPPDGENNIIVEAYSVVDPHRICTQVLRPFEESLDLGTYPGGHYTVWVNGEMAGEFDT
jgi:hypothetical protein